MNAYELAHNDETPCKCQHERAIMGMKPQESDEEVFARLKDQLKHTIITNVFEEDEFRTQFYLVFEKMAKILANTLGPYGSSTMIDQGTNYCITKDGFHVLSNLRFSDTKQNRIKSTLFSISHQMVTKVGDGSTSAVVAAFAFLKEMIALIKENKHVRPKELNEEIQNVVNKLCEIIGKNAINVNETNLGKVVRNITSIATNEHANYTRLIGEVYDKLGPNCNISYEDSETMEDGVVYEDGVYSADYYLIDRIYHNKNSVGVYDNCAVLMFDHSLDSDMWPLFIMAFNNFCYKERKTLIVIAPFYEQYLLDKIRRDAEEFVKQYASQVKVPFRMVFLKSMSNKPIYKSMAMDLSSLLGCTIYQPPDTKEWHKKYLEWEKACQAAMAEGKVNEPPAAPSELEESIRLHIGGCDQLIAGDKISSFKGFPLKNEAMFNTLFYDAKESLKEEESRVLKNDAIDNKLIDARTRFTKINCKSAKIQVGGSNRLEMSINTDAVDDAVKACASAIKYGYNQGCNLAIIRAIDIRIKEITPHGGEMTREDFEKIELDLKILNALRNAFINVYATVLRNGLNEDEVQEILDTSLSNYTCFNMVKHRFDDEKKIINSCRTDVEILKGAIAMVAVVLSCNQYISTTLNN